MLRICRQVGARDLKRKHLLPRVMQGVSDSEEGRVDSHNPEASGSSGVLTQTTQWDCGLEERGAGGSPHRTGEFQVLVVTATALTGCGGDCSCVYR